MIKQKVSKQVKNIKNFILSFSYNLNKTFDKKKTPAFLKAKYNSLPSIEKKKCTKCLVCVYQCPTNAIEKHNNELFVDSIACIQCNSCILICPTNAIK